MRPARIGSSRADAIDAASSRVITFAKAVTSGYVPFSGVVVGPRVRAALESNEGFLPRTGYTYSGHPLGALLRSGLGELHGGGLLTSVRGEGAVWGITVPDPVDAVETRNALLDEGVIIRPLPRGHLPMCPPLVITDEQLDHLVSSMRRVL